MKLYKVQMQHESLGWRDVPFAESSTLSYCNGYVDCMDSMYPSCPMRIICIDGKHQTPWHLIRETKGRAKPHTNTAAGGEG